MNLWPRSRGRPPLPPAAEPPPGAPLRVRADFEGGNVEAVSLVSPSHLRFSARADLSPRPLWFFFCIENARVPAVRCDLVNADKCLGSRYGWRTVRPVFSGDGHTWERLVHGSYVEESPSAGYFTFTVPVVGPRTWVAYSYPYTNADLRLLLEELSAVTGAEVIEMGRSIENRPLHLIRFAEGTARQHSVWVIARQHAGEAPASFVADGMVRWLAGAEAAELRAKAGVAVHILPLVDVDGVAGGRYGKDEAPVDFNRDWRPHPLRLEMDSLVRRVRASHEARLLNLVLDVHASHHGDTSCYFFGGGPDEGGIHAGVYRRLLEQLASENPIGFSATDLRAEAAPPGSCRHFGLHHLRVPALTLEASYHLAQNGEYLNPPLYRCFGAALAKALLAIFVTD